MEIARARTHGEIARRHRFEIVIEDVGLGRDHFFERAVLAQKIRRQHFDRRLRAALADGADRLREMIGAAVIEIVAIDRRHDDMRKTELGGRLGDILRLERIERARQARAHIAEGAGARAGVAHDHEGGVLLLPALADIGAARLLADRVQAVGAHDLRCVSAKPRETGALTRIQSGFFCTGASGRCAFSGWRGRGCLTVSRTTTMIPHTYGRRPHPASAGCSADRSGCTLRRTRKKAGQRPAFSSRRCDLAATGACLVIAGVVSGHSRRRVRQLVRICVSR